MSISQHHLDTASEILDDYPKKNSMIDSGNLYHAACTFRDAYRATHQPAVPGTDSEPELPEGISYDLIRGQYGYARCTDDPAFESNCPRKWHVEVKYFTQSELRAIAAHMDWRDRQRTREQEAAKVPFCAVTKAAWTRLSGMPGIPEALAQAIGEAIALGIQEAQRSEARKETK